MTTERQLAREVALKEHVMSMSANLLRAYLCEHLDAAPVQTIDTFVVVLHAQSAMPPREVSS